jgi:phytanoyl-CoA hydroxylase
MKTILEHDSILGTMTPLQIVHFYQQGYVVLPGLVDESTVEFAKTTIDDVIINQPDQGIYEPEAMEKKSPEQMTPEERVLSARGLKYQASRDPRFRSLAEYEPVVSATESLLGRHFKMLQDMALIKPPRIGSEKPHHQDCSYFEIEPFDQIVGTWWALDRATLENGCMHVWPQTHRFPTVNYESRPGTPHHVIAPELIDPQAALALPMEPGDVLFFSSRIFHYTPPNRSEMRRRSLQIHYASAFCKPIPGRTARRCLAIRGQTQPGCIQD